MFDEHVRRYARKYCKPAGMSMADLAQELRVKLLESPPTDEKAATRTLYSACGHFIERARERDAIAPMDALQSHHDAEREGSDPAYIVEREAEDITLARLAPDIEAARDSHRPLSTVRVGLARSEWLKRLVRKNPGFPVRLLDAGVAAALALPEDCPVAVRAARGAWRAEAYRRGAGAKGRPGLRAGRPVDVEKVSGRPNWADYAGSRNRRADAWPATLSSITPRAERTRSLDYISGSHLEYGKPVSDPETPAERAEIEAYLNRAK